MRVLCIILGGGRGTRLYPLTKDRCKPAVPFAGKYRLVDVPISNCLNSRLDHIYVLTQFNSESLNKHITRAYKSVDPYTKGFVEIMAAEQSMDSTDWFQGTADSVRRCLKHFNDPELKYIFILSGDQLYKMDFRELLTFHIEKNSEVTIACNPVEPREISNYGIMCTEQSGRINKFIEKPTAEDEVKEMEVDIQGKRRYLASMGIYLFNKDTLVSMLTDNKKADFGREVIPDSFANHMTYAYIYNGYWRDIGTIKTFYKESLTFTDTLPPVDLFDERWQFFTTSRYLAPAKVDNGKFSRVIISEGAILDKCEINHSIIGVRSRIGASSVIEDSIIMGSDFYESMQDLERDKNSRIPLMGIGKNCVIKKAIIDKNVRIGDGSKIINHKNLESFESDLYSIKDHIVIIPKKTIIPPRTVI